MRTPNHIIEKHTEGELVASAQQKNINEVYFHHLIEKYNQLFSEVKADFTNEDIEDGDSLREITLRILFRYLDKYIKQVEKGHSSEWADLYADSEENEEQIFSDVYYEIKAKNPQKATEELVIHCNSFGTDPLYINHFISLFEYGDGVIDPEKKTAIYSNIYEEQIAAGKTEIFAHTYAKYLSQDYYSEIFCYAYAQAYVNPIQQRKSKDYAEEYAQKFADYVGNHYSKMSKLEDDEDFDFFHERILGYMKAWEYANENKIADKARFIRIYEDIYINTMYADDGNPGIDKDELEVKILAEALSRFNKL